MTLPATPAQRRLQHRRRFDIQAGSRDDGINGDQGDACGQRVGVDLARAFRPSLLQRVGGAHLSERARRLPTAVIQAFAGDVIHTQGHDGDTRPLQVDRCHAPRRDGEAVRLHHPRWYRTPPLAEPEED